MKGDKMKDEILNWFATGRVGASSQAMACCFAGIEGDISHPSDPDDLNRCLLFLKAVPEARNHMDELRKLSTIWNELIDRWDKLENIFLAEVGLNWMHGTRATKTYELMKEIGC